MVQSDNKANSVQLILQLPPGTELGKNLSCFDTFPGGWVGGLSRSDNIANSVQLLLQLPTGTELGKKVIENNGQLRIHRSRLDK